MAVFSVKLTCCHGRQIQPAATIEREFQRPRLK
jgi:hypothetical protein